MRAMLRRTSLIGFILIMIAATSTIVGWSDLVDLRHSKVWTRNVVSTQKAELTGVGIEIQDALSMTFPERPDRAVIYLRLALEGDADRLRGWMTCDPRLIDGQGRTWLPLNNALGTEIVSLLGPEQKTLAGRRNCSQSLVSERPAISEQAYLVPTDALSGLQLEVSGLRTLPHAAVMPLQLRTKLIPRN